MKTLATHHSVLLRKFLIVAALSSLAVFGVMTFDNAPLYNIGFALLMVVLSIAHSNKANLLSLFIILGADRVIGKINIFLLLSTPVGESAITKIVIYSITLFVVIKFRYQTLSKIVLAALCIAIPIEIYWFNTGYAAPHIDFFFLGLAQAIFLRYALLMKAVIFRPLKGVTPHNMDFNISELVFLSAMVKLIMMGEYLVRHLTGFPSLVIYYAYDYLQHSINIMFIAVIAFYSFYEPEKMGNKIKSNTV